MFTLGEGFSSFLTSNVRYAPLVFGPILCCRLALGLKDHVRFRAARAGARDRRRDSGVLGHIISVIAFFVMLRIVSNAVDHPVVAERWIQAARNYGLPAEVTRGEFVGFVLFVGSFLPACALIPFLTLRNRPLRRTFADRLIPHVINNIGTLSAKLCVILITVGGSNG